MLLVRAVADDAEGLGECVAAAEPLALGYADGAADVLRRYQIPAAAAVDLDPEAVGRATAFVKGHRMAKAALELAVLDAWLRAGGQPLAGFLGATRDRVPAGVSVGIMESLPELLDAVAGYLDQGYLRIKLKVEPGWDLEPVAAAAHERFGDDLLLKVDANAAYTVADAGHLRGLDRFGLLLLEQPLAEDDLAGHAELAGRLATPICLDESITSAKAAVDAVALGPAGSSTSRPAGSAATWKARRLHDACRPGRAPVVRRHAGDGHRQGGQRGPGRPARLHPPRHALDLRPLLPPGLRRPRSSSATATSRSPPAPGSGSSPFPRSWRSLTTSVSGSQLVT